MNRPPYVAVVGPGQAAASELEQALAVGRELASRDAVVVCGGLGGVMEAVCRGAAEAGGMTVGILPGTDREQANPHVRVAIPTGLGEARNALVVRAADAVIAIAGEWGTLSEIALAMKTGKPVIGLGTWELAHPQREVAQIVRAAGAEDAVARAIGALGEPRGS